MDLQNLLNNFDSLYMDNIKEYKNISSSLYFDDGEPIPSTINENQEYEKYFNIDLNVVNKSKDTFKNFNQKNMLIFADEKYTYKRKYTFIECILNSLNFMENNSKEKFFTRITRDFDSFKLFTKFNMKTICKKQELKELMIEQNDNDDKIRYLISSYLSINIILFTNNDLKLYTFNNSFEIFKPTIYIYENDNIFYLLTEGDKKVFTSNDDINYKINKIIINENITTIKQEYKENKKLDNYIENTFEKKDDIKDLTKQLEDVLVIKEETKPKNNIDYKKLKVGELRKIAINKGFKVKKLKSNGKGEKFLTKAELICLLTQ